jgi:hypothetical protein
MLTYADCLVCLRPQVPRGLRASSVLKALRGLSGSVAASADEADRECMGKLEPKDLPDGIRWTFAAYLCS